MAKKINIPGRLHACTTEQIVAGANEIYDDVLEKKQDEINSELKLAINTNNSKVERCEEKVNTIETKVNENIVNVDDFNRNLNKVKSDIESNKNNIETLQTEQNEQKSSINSIKSKVDRQEASINNIESSINYIHERIDFVEGITAINPKNEFDSTFKHFWFYIDNSGKRNISSYKRDISECYFSNDGVETRCALFGNIYPSEYIKSKLKVYAAKLNSIGVVEFKQVSSLDYNYFADGKPTNLEIEKLDLFLRCEVDIYFKHNPNRKLQENDSNGYTDCIEVAFELPNDENINDWFKWDKGKAIGVYKGCNINTESSIVLGSRSNAFPVHGKSFYYLFQRNPNYCDLFDYDCYRFLLLMWMLDNSSFNSQKYCGKGSYIDRFSGSSKPIYPRRTGNKDRIGINNTTKAIGNNNSTMHNEIFGGNSVSDYDMYTKYQTEIEQGFGPHVISTKFIGLEDIWGGLWEFVYDVVVMIKERTISDTEKQTLFINDWVTRHPNGYINIIKLDGSVKRVKISELLNNIDTKLCYAVASFIGSDNIRILIEIKDNDVPVEEWQFGWVATKLQLTNLALLPIEFSEATNELYNRNYCDMFNVFITEQRLIDNNNLEKQVIIRGGSGNYESSGMFAIGCIGENTEQINVGARLISKKYTFNPVIDFS